MEEDALLEKKIELKIFCLKRSFLTFAPQNNNNNNNII
jgi:hypothetical protein